MSERLLPPATSTTKSGIGIAAVAAGGYAVSEVIFAVPRHEYASYQDLYALIDLSGFKKVFIDEVDPQSDNAYVVTILSGEIPTTAWTDAKAHIVVYDFEWRTEPQAPIPGVAEFWTGDKWHARLCDCRYVPMGSHAGLKLDADTSSPEVYDVAFIGYINGVHRRDRIRQQLIARGVKVSPHGAWDAERHRILSNSQTYLHVHQLENAPGIPPLRMAVAAAYGLPFLSEACADPGVFGTYFLGQPYERLVEHVHRFRGMQNADIPLSGERLHQFLCHDFTFRKSVEGAL